MESITLLFIFTSIIIIITPGQDMILVMSASITQGKKAGIITAMGTSVGLLCHTLLATLGLGALLMASEFLFTLIKFLGAFYLFYLGYQLIKNKEHQLIINDLPKVSYKKMFFQGAISNISNPKIAIFYFSYLPQFVSTSSGNETLQLFTLGLAFAILTFIMKAPIGYISGLLSLWIKTHPSVLKYIHRTSGIIFIGLGLNLLLEKRV